MLTFSVVKVEGYPNLKSSKVNWHSLLQILLAHTQACEKQPHFYIEPVMDTARVSPVENSDLGLLWKRLSELNSAIDCAQNHIKELLIPLSDEPLRIEPMSGQWKFPEKLQSPRKEYLEQEKQLQELKTKLEGRRDTTRQAINEQLRPTLRPLKIVDIPDELLRSVFDHFRGETKMSSIASSSYSRVSLCDRGNVAQVKNLRLTCRRFCDHSSHLLKYHVAIGITPQSLAHLEEVSRHPTISKGIRLVRIYLGRHFDAGIAQDFQAFAGYQASRMRDEIEKWEMVINRPEWHNENVSAGVYQQAIGRATPLVESWEDAARNGVNENHPKHVRLKDAHERYQNCYESQMCLQRGVFAEAVAHAMARMPTATWLEIDDENPRSLFDSERMYTCITFSDLEDPHSMQLILQAPTFSWSLGRQEGLRSPPVEIIPTLLSSIGEAGIRLQGVDIRTPLPDDLASLSVTEANESKLRAVAQRLRAFTYEPDEAVALSMEASAQLNRFLSVILDTSNLQRVSLDFRCQHERVRPKFSMAPNLLFRTWPGLKMLSFNGPFHFAELKKLADGLGTVVDFQWSGYLMDASWAEVLDFLQGCHLSKAVRLGEWSRDIAGAEGDRMRDHERDFIFGDDPKHHGLSMATLFIRGWLKTNPVRSWENGELVIPEAASGNEHPRH